MNKFAIAISILLLVGSVSADLSFSSFSGDFNSYNPASSGIALSDIVTVANYYGCKTWVKNQCTECSNGFYFSKNGVCCEVPTLCSQFNRAEGICTACYQGYSVVNNCCVAAAQDSGCALWNGNTCSKCSKGWFMNKGVCTPVSDQCSTWNDQGHCLTCYNGYVLANGACNINTSPLDGSSNALCGLWNGSICTKCAPRSYFNPFRICTPVADQCETWDPTDGACLSCYGGYTLAKGVCSASAIAQPSDLGCGTWNAKGDICLQCSHRFYFNLVKKCVPVSDQCKVWTAAGLCTSCYDGYDLTNGQCSQSASNTAAPSDLGCGTWDWKNQKCLKCSNNWVFNNLGACVPVSDQCQTYDLSGVCLSCYKGFNLANGKCVEAPVDQVADKGCGTWDWNKKICLQCSNNYVFNGLGVCVPVSDQCKTFDRSGLCLSCYDGYNLVSGKCQEAAVQKPSDLGCGTWDWKNQKCLKCSNNWVFNNLGVCVPVSDQCKTFDLSGQCVSCYDGYDLIKGQCSQSASNTAAPSDLGCGTWDWKNQKCLKCSNNWVFNGLGVCVPVSDQCKTFDLSGQCVSCYQGYDLKAGKCEKAATQLPSDAGCGLWDWNNQKCLQCSSNWVFSNKGICVPVSDQCKTFDLSGLCVSCYDGYSLVNGQCSQSASNTAAPSDLGCGTWDWKNQKCLKCSNNWVFNNLGACVPVSDQCQTYNLAGVCLSCYKGYDLKAGACVQAAVEAVADIGCGQWDWDKKVCLQCSSRWVFNSQKKCVPVDDNCNQWNTAGQCTSCYAGYIINEGSCTLGNSLCQVSNANGACTSCYTGYILDNGNCVPISKLANLALYYSQCCPERLATLTQSVGNSNPTPFQP
jgi:hypothetical protein